MTTASKHPRRRRQALAEAPPKMADTPRPVAPMDGRTREARRWRTLYHAYRAATPLDATQAPVDALLRSLASTTLHLERCPHTAAADDLAALLNGQLKLMDRLGLAPKGAEPARSDDDPKAEAMARIARLRGEQAA